MERLLRSRGGLREMREGGGESVSRGGQRESEKKMVFHFHVMTDT